MPRKKKEYSYLQDLVNQAEENSPDGYYERTTNQEKEHLYNPAVLKTYSYLISYFNKAKDMAQNPWGKHRSIKAKNPLEEGFTGFLFGFFGGCLWYGGKAYHFYKFGTGGQIQLRGREMRRNIYKEFRKALRIGKSFFLFSFVFRGIGLFLQVYLPGFPQYPGNLIGAGMAGGLLQYRPRKGLISFKRGFVIGFILIFLLESILNVEHSLFGTLDISYGLNAFLYPIKNPWSGSADWTGIHRWGLNQSKQSAYVHDTRKFDVNTLYAIRQKDNAINNYYSVVPMPIPEDRYDRKIKIQKYAENFDYENEFVRQRSFKKMYN